MPAKNAQDRAAYELARARREQVLLRLTKEEAQRLRDGANGAGMSLSAFVLCAVDGQARPIVDLAEVGMLSEAFTALRAAPQAVRDLEADLGRLSGRLSHFFEINYKLASEQRAELHAKLRELDALLLAIPHAIAALGRVLRRVEAALDP
jgi:uncharacterized protein (DUF1778 family)